jgi:hypothetical protein
LIIVEELKLIRDKWDSININPPSLPVGFNIIDQLLTAKNLEDHYIKPIIYSFNIRAPISLNLMRDLTDDATFFHGIMISCMEIVSVAQFHDGWTNMRDSGGPVKASPYITADVPCISDDVLAGCMDGLPSTLMEKGIMVS